MAVHMPEFNKELPPGSSLILTAPVSSSEKELYGEAVKAISNSELDNVIRVCYQKVPKDVIEYLTDCGANVRSIDKIHYIDMLSNTLGLKQNHINTSYCSSLMIFT